MARRRIAAGRSYAIGLRLGARAAEELAQPAALAAFRHWLDTHDCYVFTINGFPYGSFHGTRVKEQVYAPDWSTPERVAYTCQLFELLVQLLPQYRAEALGIHALYGSRRQMLPALRALLDFLAARLQGDPHWEEQLAP